MGNEGLIERDLTRRVIGAFHGVYNELGAGFLEQVYETSLALALRESGCRVLQQVGLDVFFRAHKVGECRADLLVDSRLVVEIKAVNHLSPIHEVQLVNYLKATKIPVGLLLNFGPRPTFRRRALTSNLPNPRSSASIRVRKPNV